MRWFEQSSPAGGHVQLSEGFTTKAAQQLHTPSAAEEEPRLHPRRSRLDISNLKQLKERQASFRSFTTSPVVKSKCIFAGGWTPLVSPCVMAPRRFMLALKRIVAVRARSRRCTRSPAEWRKVTAARWTRSSHRKPPRSSYTLSTGGRTAETNFVTKRDAAGLRTRRRQTLDSNISFTSHSLWFGKCFIFALNDSTSASIQVKETNNHMVTHLFTPSLNPLASLL